jgi:DNA-binding NarL/FixJ family response regulator
VKKTIFIFTILIVALLAIFQLSKYSLYSGNIAIELIIAAIALIFFVIGILLHKKSLQKKVDEQTAVDPEKIAQLGISRREYEILEKIAEGLSNKEIADTLFVTESTVKTHVSNLFAKLDVKRRTQAIQRAKALNLIV